MSNDNPSSGWPSPWPIEGLVRQLQEGDALFNLVQPRRAKRRHDVREYSLESLAQEVMAGHFGAENVTVAKQIGTTLGLYGRPFPARTQPDLAVEYRNSVHIAELKSSRTDYNRFDSVFDSRPFREYLREHGHTEANPWEVEQDLIKLHLYKELSPRVGSCLFLMVDAYSGPGRSWTRVFGSKRVFRETMRTDLVRGWSDTLLESTRIVPLAAERAIARLGRV